MSAESLKNMNRYTGNERKRGQNLLIVEGNHEKNRLFWLLFSCFPEIDIRMDDIWIYGTNIYMLYGDIEREYGSGWEEVDIDLPFVVKGEPMPPMQKAGQTYVMNDPTNNKSGRY